MNKKQFVAKTVDKAIELGLKELNLSQVDVDIKILDEGGFFRKAKVEIIYQSTQQEDCDEKVENVEDIKEEVCQDKNENLEEKNNSNDKEINEEKQFISQFLSTLFEKMNLSASIEMSVENNIISVQVKSENANKLIGKRGEMLNALQEILSNVTRNKGFRNFKIYFDVENYKSKRETTLITLANRTAEKAIKTNKPIKLDNMSAYERKIIHTALQDNEYVTTKSEGEEPYRHLVVIPTKK